MNELLAARALQLGGGFTTTDARECGVDANALAALLRVKDVFRVGPRAYVEAGAWREAGSPEAKHRMRVEAVARSFGGRVAVSHHSALAMHALPFWQVNENVIHLVRRRGTTSRRRGLVAIHEAYPDDGLVQVGQTCTVTPALAVIGAAMTDTVEAGIAAADAALKRQLTSRDELEQWLDRLRRRPGLARARLAVARADGRAESVGETRTRLLLAAIPGLPEVTAQFRFCDGSGHEWARADFLIGERLVVEFDGLQKYRAADADSAAEVPQIVAAEKAREDRIRRLGLVVVRLTWAELADPVRVAARVWTGLRQAEASRPVEDALVSA